MPQVRKGRPVGGTPHGVRYPWKEWFKRGRGVVTLKRGRDYHGATLGIISTIYQACRRYGVRVTLWSTEDGEIAFKRIYTDAKNRRGRKTEGEREARERERTKTAI